MQREPRVSGFENVAMLRVECASGRVVDWADGTGLFPRWNRSGPEARGDWRRALGIAGDAAPGLERVIAAGAAVALPPTLLDDALLLGGHALPPVAGVVTLLLWPLADARELAFAGPVTGTDTVAVLGVDHLDYRDPRAGLRAARLMMDIRSGLQQIVPARTAVGLPAGTVLPFVMRELPPDELPDIARALLSHLHRLQRGWDTWAVEARLSLGVAPALPERGGLPALAAANRALQRAQAEPGDGIRLAAEDDEGLQAGWSVNGDGVFSVVRPDGAAAACLRDLLALQAEPGAYMGEVLDLFLRQEGVAAAALYRREFGDSHRFAAGAIAGAGGARSATEERLPRAVREAAAPGAESAAEHCLPGGSGPALVFPLVAGQEWLGYLALGYRKGVSARERFSPDVLAMRHLANALATLPLWRMAAGAKRPGPPLAEVVEPPAPGYVEDNMEGAIDQAVFLAGVDMPVAVIGPRGTGKLYVARVIHRESGAAPERLTVIDCRELRGRREAQQRIARELARSQGRTLVFKSPHLLPAEVQQKLARQVSSRVLADASPPRALAQVRFIALFPDQLSHLERFGGLEPALASAFAGFPIEVPPLKERRRAILRWAHKILAQEAAGRDRRLRGFTPDAEEAMLRHDWPGNISEMRQLIVQALDRSAKEWITPVDLGLFRGLKADGAPQPPEQQAYLASQLQPAEEEPAYVPTTMEELGVALGEALHTMLEQDALRPLGAWLDDELVLAACERYRGDTAAAARFLRTRSRNVQRWLPKILGRDHERSASLLWQAPRRLVKAWVREAPMPAESPQDTLQAMLLAQVLRQCGERKLAERALIMGVSIPTFQKRLQELAATDSGEQTP